MTILSAIMITIIVGLLMAFPVMWLWNAVMPEVFGLIRIDFAQALMLNLLSGFLIKGTDSSN